MTEPKPYWPRPCKWRGDSRDYICHGIFQGVLADQLQPVAVLEHVGTGRVQTIPAEYIVFGNEEKLLSAVELHFKYINESMAQAKQQ